jgi:hypothetical protein
LALAVLGYRDARLVEGNGVLATLQAKISLFFFLTSKSLLLAKKEKPPALSDRRG